MNFSSFKQEDITKPDFKVKNAQMYELPFWNKTWLFQWMCGNCLLNVSGVNYHLCCTGEHFFKKAQAW